MVITLDVEIFMVITKGKILTSYMYQQLCNSSLNGVNIPYIK